MCDDAFVAQPVERLAALFHDPRLLAVAFPKMQLEVAEERGLKGVRWRVQYPLLGRAEVWLEPAVQCGAAGTIVHHYVQGALINKQRGGPTSWGRAYRRTWKRFLYTLAGQG